MYSLLQYVYSYTSSQVFMQVKETPARDEEMARAK